MKYEMITLAKNDHLATLTLNRPDSRNAINKRMMEELVAAIEDVAEDNSIRALLLTGAGKSFCAGADLDIMPGGGKTEELGELGVEVLRSSFLFKASKRIMMGLQQMEKPTIAMINGACVGAGFDLALACDLRTASDDAKFMCGFVKLGLFPGFGATWFYPRAMGLGKAMEMLFTGDTITALDAKHIGMLNHVAPPEDLEKITMEMVLKIVNGPPIAIRMMKSQVYKGLISDLNTTLTDAAVCESITLTSKDHLEGITAFREKRPPSFKGI
jgi:enoyl-CoA hydratase/carnithine racemase